MAEHGTAQHDLGRKQAAGPAGPSVDHQVESRRRHESPPCEFRSLSKVRQPRATPSQRGAARPFTTIETGERTLPAARSRTRRRPSAAASRADCGKPPHRGSQADSQIDPPTQQPVSQPRRHPEEVCEQPESPQVLPREQEAVANRQRVAAIDSQFGPEGAEAPMIGDGLGLVIPLEAGHPAAEAQVEVLDPSREIDRDRSRQAPGTCGGRRPARDPPPPSGRPCPRRCSWPGTRHIPWTSPNLVRTRVLIPSYSRPSKDQQSGAENNASSWFSNTPSKDPPRRGPASRHCSRAGRPARRAPSRRG